VEEEQNIRLKCEQCSFLISYIRQNKKERARVKRNQNIGSVWKGKREDMLQQNRNQEIFPPKKEAHPRDH